MAEERLFFLHLSDIHFQKPLGGDLFDLDKRLRDELENDAQEAFRSFGVPPTAILITGDISFKGASDLYDRAWAWLEQSLCAKLHCPTENICCIPGNHDVNRSVLDKRPIIDCYRNLRTVDPKKIDGLIQEYLGFSEFFYDKLAEYNRFALKFSSDITDHHPFWDRSFTLNDGSRLQVRGINSTLVSDSNDHIDTGKMVIGQYQCSLSRQDGTEYLILCHHPPQWLRDIDEFQQSVNPVAVLQLYGHKHKRQVQEVDGTLCLMAGALHPERDEAPWEPAYNFFGVKVQGDVERSLEVDVYPRIWSPQRQKFIPDYETCDGASHRVYTLKIKKWLRLNAGVLSVPETTIEPQSATPSELTTTGSLPQPATQDHNMDPNRTLAHRFLSLAFVDRMQIAQNLGLLTNDDEGRPEGEVYKAFFRRAKARNLLAELWDLVESRHADSKYTENPFRVKGDK